MDCPIIVNVMSKGHLEGKSLAQTFTWIDGLDFGGERLRSLELIQHIFSRNPIIVLIMTISHTNYWLFENECEESMFHSLFEAL